MVEALLSLPNRRCMTEVKFGWCGRGLELDWMYLGEFLSNFRKN
jgi:hypothetical protein